MEEKLLTVKELAQEYRVSEITVYRAIKAGKLPVLRVGRSIRIRRDEAEKIFRGGEKNQDE